MLTNAQFLCVMNGGILVQDCTGHCLDTTHPISDGKVIYEITSTHHQMQYPYNLKPKDYTILFKALNNFSYKYEGDGVDSEKIFEKGEPEIVLYHKKGFPKCLAIQGHPELIPNSPVSKMLNNLINELVNGLK